MALQISAEIETWPLAKPFRIARGSRTEAVVVTVTARNGGKTGRGECVPYARYGEDPESVLAQIRSIDMASPDKLELQALLPPGAARNAVDCALWDLEAKTTGIPVASRCLNQEMTPVKTAYTISLGSPKSMGRDAKKEAWRPLLKIKLGGGSADFDRLAAVRKAAPNCKLIVDANEGWPVEHIQEHLEQCAMLAVDLIEQPLPANKDSILAGMARPVPVCADESVHISSDLPTLAQKYDAVNIKLDKTGGLTEALALAGKCRENGLQIMMGCMVGTSLAMAPAMIPAQLADWIDLDGPLLLKRDRAGGLVYSGSCVEPPDPSFWG